MMIVMVHTYRRHEASNGLLRLAATVFNTLLAVTVACALMVVSLISLWRSLTASADRVGPGMVLAGCVFAGWVVAYWLATECQEIRLGDDGTCEFQTRWRVVRAQVTQIESVREEIDEDGDAHYYMHLRKGGNLWTVALSDIEDFLARIATLNPAIEIRRRKS